MTKAFRNTGIEGGSASFGTSVWLAGQEREARRRAAKESDSSIRWKSISVAKEKPSKDIASWRFVPDQKAVSALLLYANDEDASFHGSWLVSVQLWGRGLIEMVKPPTKWAHYGGHERPTGMGSLFVITGRGLQYVNFLKSKPQ